VAGDIAAEHRDSHGEELTFNIYLDLLATQQNKINVRSHLTFILILQVVKTS
jgi:hypothetical protein